MRLISGCLGWSLLALTDFETSASVDSGGSLRLGMQTGERYSIWDLNPGAIDECGAERSSSRVLAVV